MCPPVASHAARHVTPSTGFFTLWSAPRVQVKRAFSEFDKDGSGCLDEEELGMALTMLGIKAGKTELRKIFLKYDEDGNGEIDLQERCPQCTFEHVIQCDDLHLSVFG